MQTLLTTGEQDGYTRPMASAVREYITDDGEILTIEYTVTEDGSVKATVREYPQVQGVAETEEEARLIALGVLDVTKVIVKEALGEKEFQQKWVPQTLDDVNFLMERVALLESEIQAISHRKQALVSNLDHMMADIQRTIRSIFWLYGHHIRRIAEQSLAGKKTRTLKLDWGILSFRRLAGRRIPLMEPDQLVEWAEKESPEIVRVKRWVNTSDLPDSMVRVEGAGDAFYVSTSKENQPIHKEEPGA